jgi:hypothetical protein
MSESVPARPRRIRPWLRRFAIAAFAVLLPIAAHSMWDYVEIRRLAREIQQIIDRGEPVTLANEPRPSSPRDAASYYIAGGVLGRGFLTLGGLGPVRDWLAWPNPDRRALEPLLEPLRRDVEAAQEALRLADTAATLPFEGYAPGTDFSYRGWSITALSELTTARTLSLSAQGDGDGAVRSLLSRIQFERILRYESPFRISGHQAAGVLSLSRPSPEALRQLQAALAATESLDNPVRVLQRQRARYLEAIWHQYYGPDSTNPRNLRPFRQSFGERVMRPVLSRRLAEQLRTWSELLDIARQPWPARAALRRAVLDGAQTARVESAFWVTSSKELAHDAFGLATDPTRLITDRASLAAVAIERYRRDHNDALPPTLGGLVPDYIPNVPVDPFTGRELLFRATANAYTIYSVGPNAADDGGELTKPAPRGSARPIAPGADVGVRVLLSVAQ